MTEQSGENMEQLRGIIGVAAILLLAFLFSNHKRKIKWRPVLIAFFIQVLFAIFALKLSFCKLILEKIANEPII